MAPEWDNLPVRRATRAQRSHELLISVMWRVLAVNVAAAMLGQAYSDLLQSAKTRTLAYSRPAALAGAICAYLVLLVFAAPPIRRWLGSYFSARHAATTGTAILVALGVIGILSASVRGARRSPFTSVTIDLPAHLLWVIAVVPFAWRRARQAFGLRLGWLDREAPPSAEERAALVAMPAAVAMFTLPYWVFLAVINLVTNALTPGIGGLSGQGAFFGVLFTWLATAAITYLLTEQRLRPVFAEALRSGPRPELATIGIRKRLAVAWALGSGIPFAFVIASPGALDKGGALGDRAAVAGTFVLLGCVGIVAGYLTTRAAARSVAEPLARVQQGLDRVGDGDLAAELLVNDAGEIGLIMAGFNRMVSGLRERAILEDLFGRHVGADVARRALEDRAALGGELRDVTVFFVDMVGSTALAESSSPVEVVGLLNRFFSAVVAAVSAEGGWVNKFEGDGALCVFGAPAAQGDHAARALRAACALRHALLEVADAGIGVATGEAVVGNVGAEERYEYTVVGRPVNAAARLTDEAKRRPTRMLAMAETVGHADDEAKNWTEVGYVELRGVAVPVLAFEPLAVPLRQPGDSPSR